MMLGSRELDGEPFPAERLDALYAAIRVNDVIDEHAPPPATVRLDYDRDWLIDGFRLSRQLWREGFDRADLIDMARDIGAGGGVEPATAARFKDVRAKFKHLRFAFVLYAADHRCPVAFKALTTIMGQVQDAARNGRRRAAARQAALLRLSLNHLPQALLAREVDRLVPSSPADFRSFVLDQIGSLRAMLGAATITGHRFHAARKVVSRQVSFHDDMRIIHPDPAHDAMARYLATINGLMGRFHDDLVRRHTLGELDYANASFALPPAIAQRLAALASLYP